MEEKWPKMVVTVSEGTNGGFRFRPADEEKIKVKVPIGFRFRPTDEELVVHYLRRKVLSLPLPASVISDNLHVFTSDPWSLPGDLREKKYYFWKRKGELGRKSSRLMATSSGFWKAVGKSKQIISSGAKNDVVGIRKSWAFYQISKNNVHGFWSKTRWFMHEFQLLDSIQDRTGEMQDNWVVCRVFQRKLRPKNQGINSSNYGRTSNFGIMDIPNVIDFKVENSFNVGPPEPSSPSLVD